MSACDSNLYVVVACCVPALGLIIEDNQSGIGNKINNMNNINNLGWYSEITKESFLKNQNELAGNNNKKKLMSEKVAAIVDGRGAKRISKIILY